MAVSTGLSVRLWLRRVPALLWDQARSDVVSPGLGAPAASVAAPDFRLKNNNNNNNTHTQGETTTGALNTRHETPRPFLPFSDPLLSCPLLPLSVRYGLAHAQVQSRSDSSVTIYSPNPSSHRVALSSIKNKL